MAKYKCLEDIFFAENNKICFKKDVVYEIDENRFTKIANSNDEYISEAHFKYCFKLIEPKQETKTIKQPQKICAFFDRGCTEDCMAYFVSDNKEQCTRLLIKADLETNIVEQVIK